MQAAAAKVWSHLPVWSVWLTKGQTAKNTALLYSVVVVLSDSAGKHISGNASEIGQNLKFVSTLFRF